ncbi:MAG: hypothetical protein QOJ65_1820 [Fimbriimonadaceae bacterium]|jgi:uncharacterized damage-inducible protein DinB|nr:hypothetical protein [Fimbriimonadaceae bacterium]
MIESSMGLCEDMRALFDVWQFTRERLKPSHEDLSQEQLQWRPHPGTHSLGEILYHIAGAEHYWASRFSGRDPRASEWEDKLDRAVTDGFLKEAPAPFGPDEMTPELITRALEFTASEIAPILESPTSEQLEMPIISPIGDHINGYQGMLRLVQHASYHTGQIWIIRTQPAFPTI